MDSTAMAQPQDSSELRSRTTEYRDSPLPSEQPESVPKLPTQEDDSKPRKTYGRVPDGNVFVVPQTHDMVSTLLSPSQPKNFSDVVILGVLALHIVLFFALPSALQTPVLLIIFLFWRASYNAGIGYLLHVQSHHGQLVHWAKKYAIFDPSRRPQIYKLLKHEIETKIGDEVKNGDYVFDKAPIEFNTWLVFRRLVDLILMCDFTSYMLFAASCFHWPPGEGLGWTIARWVGGVLLFVFNIWVKLDAHRVVKDYAWYWGDFFFLVDQNLTFDGVFEMAPHPMYSVGYAGYYGISLVAASYTVLFASIIAHAAQFAFLSIVENPHIEKTYNPPAPRRKIVSGGSPNLSQESLSRVGSPFAPVVEEIESPPVERPLMQKPDLSNSTHFTTFLLLVYLAAMTLLTPTTPFIQALFVAHAFLWRMWHTVGIGAILVNQSQRKGWYRHFLKIGETREAAWRQWRTLFYVSLCMCNASFIAAGWKLYHYPSDGERMVLFRHTVGVMLIALQVWTAFSTYESLGEFGWFFGDFFFDQMRPHLTYSGIYRYLNNPERLIGCAGIWGIVLIASSPAIFLLGLFSHICALLFINVVERPHMQKLYGNQIRRDAGVVKTIKKAIPPPVAGHVKSLQGSIDKVLAEAGDFVEDFLESTRPQVLQRVMGVVKDTQALLSQYPARLSITLLADDLAKYDPKKYSLTILNGVEQRDCNGGVRQAVGIRYGDPIRVEWTAPKDHARKDWIGLYRVADNASREVTRLSSMGRWVAVCKDEYDNKVADEGIVCTETPFLNEEDGEEMVKGVVEFGSNKTFWKSGVYELRYHLDGKHNVMAISLPFEIALENVQLEENEIKGGDAQLTIEERLLPVVQRCFERRPELAPEDVTDEFGGLHEEKYAKRIVYAVKEMFGVDFTPEVVQADGNVRKLAWRICNAKRVLAPFSMNTTSASSPTSSPPATPKLGPVKM